MNRRASEPFPPFSLPCVCARAGRDHLGPSRSPCKPFTGRDFATGKLGWFAQAWGPKPYSRAAGWPTADPNMTPRKSRALTLSLKIGHAQKHSILWNSHPATCNSHMHNGGGWCVKPEPTASWRVRTSSSALLAPDTVEGVCALSPHRRRDQAPRRPGIIDTLHLVCALQRPRTGGRVISATNLGAQGLV